MVDQSKEYSHSKSVNFIRRYNLALINLILSVFCTFVLPTLLHVRGVQSKLHELCVLRFTLHLGRAIGVRWPKFVIHHRQDLSVFIGGSRVGMPGTCSPLCGPNSFIFAYIFGEKHPCQRSMPPYGKSWIRHWYWYWCVLLFKAHDDISQYIMCHYILLGKTTHCMVRLHRQSVCKGIRYLWDE